MYTAESSLKNHVYTSLLNEIIQGNYSFDQIINEKELMEKYEVSRAPIREALVKLCSENVLYSIPYRGYRITPVSQKDLMNVKDFRCTLECGFMRDNWEKLTPQAMKPIEDLYADISAAQMENDAITHWNENIHFHLSFFEIYDNEFAYQSLNSAMSLQTRAYAQTRWDEWHSRLFMDVSEFHLPLLVAIRENDKERAIEMLQSDIRSI